MVRERPSLSLMTPTSCGFYFLFVLMTLGCGDKVTGPDYSDRIIVLGHIYSWNTDGSKVDQRLEDIDYEKFKAVWLGGDVCGETTREESTLDYIDGLFDLSDPHTLWAVGNHDLRNGNFHFITERSNRDLFYRHDIGDVAVLVFNTLVEHEVFRDSCQWKSAQGDFVHTELDELISDTSKNALVILTHNTVWSSSEPEFADMGRIGNQEAAWMNFYCNRPSVFRTEFFSKVKQIKESGKHVIFIAGDGGQYDKAFYHLAESGIEYYVTGINNSILQSSNTQLIESFNTNPDSILLLTQLDDYPFLEGEFKSLSEIQ